MRYLVVIVGFLALAGPASAAAEEPGEVSYGLPPGGIEVHLPTPPQQQLAGADILVQRWNPEQASPQELDTKGWVPGAPDPFSAPQSYTTPPMSWAPGQPSALTVHTWSPGERSLIVVHGAY